MDKLSEAIRARTEKTETCWIWMGTIDRHGYGYMTWQGKPHRAHRLSWIAANGPVTHGLCVCHHCDNPGCVRPSHLFLGTPKDNVRDMIAKGRYVGRRKKQPVQ